MVLTAAGELVRAAGRAARGDRRQRGQPELPERVHGKVFFTIAGRLRSPATTSAPATAVRSNGHTLAWTAGHCVNDPEFGGGFATNWIFVPGYLQRRRPVRRVAGHRAADHRRLGRATPISARTSAPPCWRATPRARESRTRSAPVRSTSAWRASQQYAAFGYPAQPTLFHPTFDGQRLYSCVSPVTGSDNPPGNGPETMQIDCDMSGGSSGGGWVTANGSVNGLTSYGYELDFDHLYGPYFGTDARNLYHEAVGQGAALRRRRGDEPRRLRTRRLQRRRRTRRLQGQGRRRSRPRLRRRRHRLRRRRRRQAEGRRRTPTAARRRRRRRPQRRPRRRPLHRRPGPRPRPGLRAQAVRFRSAASP